MDEQLNLFDPQKGREARDAGKELAAANRVRLLEWVRRLAMDAALQREDRTACADDVYREFMKEGVSMKALGPSAGSLFDGEEWEFTGRWKQSSRITNHGRRIMVWRLK